jgi:uncharacterized protein with FMN-binding domain
MKAKTVRRSVSALIVSAALPGGSALAATHAAAPAKTVKTYKYKGPSEDMQWGPVQVTITVKHKRMTGVKASVPTERPRSMFINQQAVPILRQEALQAKSAKIDEVSGATLTSDAFAESLQGAIKKAKHQKTLK